jgi:2-keto-4-pentenoate hydratase/2-oxohepta-3-ene-1,7-dioic acid hydratase in catechol pathway
MKIVRFELEKIKKYGLLEQDNIFSVEGNIFADFDVGKKLCNLNDVRLLPPIEPKIVVGVGKNYKKNKIEVDEKIPHEPQLFFKPPSSVIGHMDNIIYPKISNDVRYGAELAVVMKYKAENVTEDRALDYVLGYTCGNDLSAFDLSKRDTFVTRVKSFYTFCPLGPCIATGIDGSNLKLESRLNGILQQHGSTSEMIFNIKRIISHITEFMALEPGDVILTGTVGAKSSPVNIGDTIEIEIEGIGLLRNVVVQQREVMR